MAVPPISDTPAGGDWLLQAGHLEAEGRRADAVRLLVRENRTRSDPTVDRRIVRLRRDAFAERGALEMGRLIDPGEIPAVDPATGMPTLNPSELSAKAVRAGILSRGIVRVRHLFSADRAAALRRAIDSAFAARERAQAGDTSEETVAWYDELEDVKEPGGRAFVADGGVYAGDSPRGLSALVGAYHDEGIDRLVTDYFGESPALSFEKTALRRVDPAPCTSWHQDGAFLGGAGIRSLNLWVALSECGRSSPGLEIIPRRVEHIVRRGGMFEWDIADATLASEFPGVTPVMPEFQIGDALLFDHLCVHRTGQAPGMTEARYALESWFFAPSVYPDMLTGLLF